MQDWKQAFYSSQAWRAAREAAKKRDRYLCVDCRRAGRITPATEVHHIVPLTADNYTDPMVALRLDNLKSLCRECHNKYNPRRVPRRYKVDEYGRVQIPTEAPPGE